MTETEAPTDAFLKPDRRPILDLVDEIEVLLRELREQLIDGDPEMLRKAQGDD